RGKRGRLETRAATGAGQACEPEARINNAHRRPIRCAGAGYREPVVSRSRGEGRRYLASRHWDLWTPLGRSREPIFGWLDPLRASPERISPSDERISLRIQTALR